MITRGLISNRAKSKSLNTVSTRTIPLSTAYAVWTAIGAVGTVIVGIVAFGDPVTFWRLFFLAAIVAIVIGLKALAGAEAGACQDE